MNSRNTTDRRGSRSPVVGAAALLSVFSLSLFAATPAQAGSTSAQTFPAQCVDGTRIRNAPVSGTILGLCYSSHFPARMSPTAMLRAVLVALLTAGAVLVGASAAYATNSFSNAAIADQALTHVGQSAGQCKQFANDMVWAASGGTVGIGGGYYAPYSNAGGVMVSAANAAKGDIIQLNKMSNAETYHSGMHTAIVVSYQGNGTFDVVDSNWGTPLNNEIVHHHTWNPFTTASQYGLTVNIWRLGQVTLGTVQTGPDDPKGNYEGLQQVAGGVRLTGWALDPNTANPIAVHVYEGTCCANPRGAFTANVPRPDVGAAFPGYGNDHGFDTFLSLPAGIAGSKTYCVYAINTGAGNVSPELGCRTVTFNWNPIGNYEGILRVPGGVHLTGWATDLETSSPIAVHVYEGTCCANPRGAFTANNTRPDVGAAFPGSGDIHGFEIDLGVAPSVPSAKTYCVYAINTGYGNASPELACRSITVDPNVTGNFESIQAVPGGARVAGWTIDPDIAGSTEVHFYEGNCCTNPRGAFVANVVRADVGAAFPGYGDVHGFDVVVSLPPGFHTLCAYGINGSGTGGANKDLGCRSVTI